MIFRFITNKPIQYKNYWQKNSEMERVEKHIVNKTKLHKLSENEFVIICVISE